MSWGLTPGHVLSSRVRRNLAVPVVDGVGEAEELAGRPGAHLVRVGVARAAAGMLVRPDAHADRVGGVVGDLVRAFLAGGEERAVPRAELLLTRRRPQRRAALENDQPLLLAALVVVRADALPRPDAVDRQPELLRGDQRADADVVGAVAGRGGI